MGLLLGKVLLTNALSGSEQNLVCRATLNGFMAADCSPIMVSLRPQLGLKDTSFKPCFTVFQRIISSPPAPDTFAQIL